MSALGNLHEYPLQQDGYTCLRACWLFCTGKEQKLEKKTNKLTEDIKGKKACIFTIIFVLVQVSSIKIHRGFYIKIPSIMNSIKALFYQY